jgi:hypothetical protein
MNKQEISKGRVIISLLILLNAIVLEQGLVVNDKWYWVLLLTVPVLIISQVLRRRS